MSPMTPVWAMACPCVDATLLQERCDDACGPFEVELELGIGVEVTADGDDLVEDGVGMFFVGHDIASAGTSSCIMGLL